MASDDSAASPSIGDGQQLYFIETYLRQQGDYETLLAVDALVLRDDLQADQKAARLQTIIQGALHGKR